MTCNPAVRALCATVSLLVVGAGSAGAADAHDARSGGASAPEPPEVAAVKCTTTDTCVPGQVLRVTGENLARVSAVVFKGRRGRADDRRTRARSKAPHRLKVRVPSRARTGRLKVISPFSGAARSPRVKLAQRADTPAATSPAPGAGVFPVQGKYDFGTETNRFGGGRNHKGQDVFASCGTPVVSALAGRVTWAKWHDAAGNYVVVKAGDGTSQAYMHLLKRATVQRGDRVKAGQPIGQVGETGRATGCHLHFELWTAPGWYDGGEAVDPLPSLRRWASAESSN